MLLVQCQEKHEIRFNCDWKLPVNTIVSKIKTINSSLKHPFLLYPKTLQFPVNDICNSRCQMCDIWKQKKDHEISANDLQGILRDSLYKNVESVGFNGGEPTLRKELIQLVSVAIQELPRLKSVSLITNAINQEQVIRSITEIVKITTHY